MPLSKYFGGHGAKVMRSMRKQYGARAEEVFYRTANKMKKRGKRGGKTHSAVRAALAKKK